MLSFQRKFYFNVRDFIPEPGVTLSSDDWRNIFQREKYIRVISPDMFGLVVASLRGGIDGAVWDLPAGDAERFHHPTLGLLHALGRLGVDGDVAGLVAGELHLAALLVALGDLFSISRTARVLADWAFAPQCSKVPGSVLHAGHDVRLLRGLSSQAESLVLAAEQESCLVGGGLIVSVVSAGDLRWGPAVN